MVRGVFVIMWSGIWVGFAGKYAVLYVVYMK